RLQIGFLSFLERATIRLLREGTQGVELPRDRRLFELQELLGVFLEERLAVDEELLKRLRRVLRGEAHELRQVIVLGHRLATDETLLIPEPIERLCLLIAEEEPEERFVFAVEHLERHDFI